MFEPTFANITTWAHVLEAVIAQKRIVANLPGDRYIDGMLRALTPESDTPVFARASQDVTTTWVRITTVQGFETWVMTEELVAAYGDGLAGFR